MAGASLTIKAILSFLAREAENQNERTSNSCLHNLGRLSENTNRIVLAGMLADLCEEHRLCVAVNDVADPDPTLLVRSLCKFESRMKFLFQDGNIMTVPGTYTEQMYKFLGTGYVLTAKKTEFHFCPS